MAEFDSITPDLDGQVWLKSIRYPLLNRAVSRVLFRDPSVRRDSRSTTFPATGRSVAPAVTDRRLGRRFELSILTGGPDHLAEARDLDLTLASGDVFFIHVPADSPVPGGYVAVGESTQVSLYGHVDSPHEFTLPCTVVAPPSAEVVGTTLNWRTVRRLYGSWQAIRSANPTWGDLLDTVGDLDDLVVL